MNRRAERPLSFGQKITKRFDQNRCRALKHSQKSKMYIDKAQFICKTSKNLALYLENAIIRNTKPSADRRELSAKPTIASEESVQLSK